MKLDRKTGRRVPVLNDPTALKQYCDERLRIVADQQFAMAKERLSSRKRSTCGNARSADLIRTFTGHLFCDDCGSAFYSRKSKNAKGEYIYYQCGCRQRRGPESCPNAITLREDKLLAGLQDVCASAFSDIEAMIEASIVEAKKTAQVNGSEAERLRGELAQTDREIGAVASLLSDPDVIGEPLAKKAVLRRAADLEGRRDAVLKALDRLLDKSNDDTDRLADIVRERFLAAKQRWEDLASPAQLNQLIGELVGPSLVNSDGQLLAIPENKNPAYACGARGVIAGGGFEPPTSGL